MKAFLQKHLNYFTFLVVLLLLILLKIINPSFIKSVSYLSFDLYQKVFAKKKESEVVIIDIDEKSLGKFGQFPWNRNVFAKILDQLNTSNPKAVGFDIFFTEKDKQSPDEIIKSYNLIPDDVAELQKLKGPDDIFSLEPKELQELCESSNIAWKSLGKIDYSRKSSELTNLKFRRSLYFIKDLKEGEIIKEEHIKSIRPGYGLKPKYLKAIIGLTVNSNVCAGFPVKKEYLNNSKFIK